MKGARCHGLAGQRRCVTRGLDGGLRLQVLLARLGQELGDVSGAVLVGVFGAGTARLLRHKLRLLLLEGIRDVLEEEEAENNVLVRGGVPAAAKRVGSSPQLGLEARFVEEVRKILGCIKLRRYRVCPSSTRVGGGFRRELTFPSPISAALGGWSTAVTAKEAKIAMSPCPMESGRAIT